MSRRCACWSYRAGATSTAGRMAVPGGDHPRSASNARNAACGAAAPVHTELRWSTARAAEPNSSQARTSHETPRQAIRAAFRPFEDVLTREVRSRG
ncbi:hypothetical protein [Gemmata massiliana]|uniref:hypothetical protein n=1 Tax=Gemmata massiliana TaxID=1210884 RepID=UPI0013A6D647|nr:hypothetical protein [Gemmata massiliana]